MESANRTVIPYENRSEMFIHNKKEYKQYAHVYSARLKILGDLVKAKASKKWSAHPFKQLYELREDQQETCIIIGTLFKHQALKPNILNEVADEEDLIEQPLLSNYVDEQDKLILEDDLQRIRLTGKIEVHKVVTGVVCAVLGYVEGDGKFIVEDVIYNESGPQAPLKTLEDDLFVVLISGLNLSNNSNIAEDLDLLKYWLYGCFGSSEVMDPKSIVRVIIAGNSINAMEQSDQNDFSDTLSSVQQLDTFISDLTLSIPVDLMPGETDPTNLMLPQQPLHACMLPKSRSRDTFCSVTNPYQFKGHDRLILGTSGQNVADILRFSTIPDEISALKATLEWSHIAPTAPDTLPSYPYYNEDPFILNEMPHVYFAGNCKKFETQEVNIGDGKSRIICVPKFSETKQVVLLNLKNLECKPMSVNFDDQ